MSAYPFDPLGTVGATIRIHCALRFDGLRIRGSLCPDGILARHSLVKAESMHRKHVEFS